MLPGATVTVTGIEAANKATAIEPVKAPTGRLATIPQLAPGRYSVQAEFAGFETRMLPDVRVRNGNNKQVLMLPIEGHKETVLVGQDKQAAAADPRGSSFGTTLTREQLDALSDDPDMLRQQLQDMAGPGAVIKIDSFEGGALPTKAQIRSIRISRDQFAAEHHAAGGVNIEIITQPGLGPIRMNVGYRMVGDGLSGRSPFTPERGPEVNRNLFVGGGGTLIKNKSSFNLFFNDNVHGADAEHQRRAARRPARAPRRWRRGSRPTATTSTLNVDYALTVDQTLRFGAGYTPERQHAISASASGTRKSAPTRATATTASSALQQIGPLGRRAFLRTRFQYRVDRYRQRRRPSKRRPSASSTRSRAAARRSPAASTRKTIVARLGSRLRARQPHLAHRRCRLTRSRWRSDDQVQLSRHLHLREPRGVTTPDGRAATRAASAIRTSATTTCRARSTRRTTSASGAT